VPFRKLRTPRSSNSHLTASNHPRGTVAVHQRSIPGHKIKSAILRSFQTDVGKAEVIQKTDCQSLLILYFVQFSLSLKEVYP